MSNTYSPDEYFKIINKNTKNIVATQQLIGKLIGVLAAKTNCKEEIIQTINSTVALEKDMIESVEYSKNAMLTAINLVKFADSE
ncbi:TPA: hypothetical protein ACVTET_004443 [Salmonella enterica subsp. salamae]